MQALTGAERIYNILRRRPVDRIGLYEHIWDSTLKKWVNEGFIKENEEPEKHFNFDIKEFAPFNYIADINAGLMVIEENEETELVRDGNGVVYRRHKKHAAGRQYFDFTVKERKDWEEKIKPLLKPDRGRINLEGYRKAKEYARKHGMFFVCFGLNVFELMRSICGHENMLIGMALDPGWIKDMVEIYSQLNIDLMEELFSEKGYPDGIWFAEDLGYKDHSFISLEMYRELIQPGHKKIIDYVHSHNLPFILHSCGMIEGLLKGFIESGIDCLQAIEIKAGMDLLRIYKDYGEYISLIGGIDTRVLSSGNYEQIDAELEKKIPVVMGNYGYVLHSDHSIPDNVLYKTYKYFIDKGMELGVYK